MSSTLDWLDDVRGAQTSGGVGATFAAALAEIEAGRKRTHWVWYVFPQIPGLGSRSLNIRFAVPSFEAAQAFLRDETTGSNFRTVLEAAVAQLASGVELPTLMHDDARKFVSSVTLMGAAADACGLTELGGTARSALELARRDGFEPCRRTLDWIEREEHPGTSDS